MTEINGERSQSLASDIVSNFQEYEASGFRKKMERRCIYKCPYGLITIKNLKGKHIPHMVSFGPYHYGEGHLQAMEFHKRRALHGIVIGARLPPSPTEAQAQLRLRLRPFMDALSEVEEELRDCYDHQLGPELSPSKPFLEMMLLDGCFMLKLLRCTKTPDNSNFGSSGTPPDPIFGPNVSPYMRAVLRRDMLMLENQIPLLVLERLLHVKNSNRLQRGRATCNYAYLNRLIIDFFGFKLSEKPDLGSRRGLHVLDVYRECLIGSPTQVPNQNPNPSPRRSCDATAAAAPNGRTPAGHGQAEETASHSQAGDQLDQNSGTCRDNIGVPEAHTIEMGSQNTGQQPDQNSRTLYQDSIVVDCFQSEESNGSQEGGNQRDQNCCGLSRKNIVLHTKSTGVPCAKWLRDAGVTFKKSHGGRFSDVHFAEKNGVLSLPFLEIDEDTAAKFMNLIAFERMHPSIGGQVTSYFLFMDALLDTGEDVRLLISKGIVRNELGSDDAAAKLFNSLGDGVVDSDVQNDGVPQLDAEKSVRFLITEVRRKLNAYASSKWNTWIADLKHKYFISPWACMSLFAAILLIVLTILQTAYGVSAFYKG